MSDAYHLAGDHAPPTQLALGLEIRLDPATPISKLHPGDRFVLEGTEVEGKLLTGGSGSVSVAIRGADGKWSRTTWSPAARVRHLRG